METQSRTYPVLIGTLSDQAKESHPESGLTRRVLAYNDKLFLAEHHIVKGWAEAIHNDPHDDDLSRSGFKICIETWLRYSACLYTKRSHKCQSRVLRSARSSQAGFLL